MYIYYYYSMHMDVCVWLYIYTYNIFKTWNIHISNYAWHYYCQLADFILPRYHQIHSTVSWRPVLLCERRRTCYCTSLHTHSRGNTPAETTAVLQHSFFRIPVMTLFVARRASPRPRGPAEGRLGLRCYSLLPHIPPEHQISTCCCSRYRSETKTCQTVHLSLDMQKKHYRKHALCPKYLSTTTTTKMSKNANT